MSITPQKIKHIAHLARLEPNEKRTVFYAQQLSKIMELVDQMNAVNTDNVEPMPHPQDVSLRLRQDQVTTKNEREAYQSIAPDIEQGLYLVPKVID